MGFLGGGGGGGDSSQTAQPNYIRHPNPRPVSPYTSAGGGFLGRTPLGSTGTASSVPASSFNSEYYLAQNPDVAKDPYYGKNPFEHYQDFGFAERRTPFQGFQYAPSQQPMYDAFGQLTGQGQVAAMTTSPEFQRQQDYNRAYTEAFRPDYKEFGPSGQYYQPIYQSSYDRYQQPSYFYSPGYTMQSPFSYPQGGYGSVSSSSARSAPTNTIGGIGVGGRLAEGGQIDDNPGDDEGIRALLGRQ